MQKTEFWDILVETVSKDFRSHTEVRKATQPQNHWHSAPEPSCLNALLGTLEKANHHEQRGGKVYSKFQKPARPRPNHKLNDIQEQAFAWFQARGVSLNLNFSRAELQKAFRKLALRLHPDQGGAAHDFMILQRQYKTLNQVL